MDTSVETLRELKRKYDEERDSNEKKEKIWLETKLEGFQRCVKHSAEEGEEMYSTYVLFRPSETCMNILQEKFPGCKVTKNESDFSDTHYEIKINWSSDEIPSSAAIEELEDELNENFSEDEENEVPENELKIAENITDEQRNKLIQDEMYSFYERWKKDNIFKADAPEWVKRFENSDGVYIPSRGYDWQNK
jgi:hypothetical protein